MSKLRYVACCRHFIQAGRPRLHFSEMLAWCMQPRQQELRLQLQSFLLELKVFAGKQAWHLLENIIGAAAAAAQKSEHLVCFQRAPFPECCHLQA